MFKEIELKLYTALITPMNIDGTVDFISFKKIIMIQEQKNIGILILGSTGEGMSLNFEEKCAIILFIKKLYLNIPVIVGIGGYDLPQQLKFMGFCENCKNITAFLLVTPIYTKPGIKGQTLWFKSLLSRSSKPCMLYNIPSRSGVSLHYEVLHKLETFSNLWALKESSGDIEVFKTYKKIIPRLSIYCGDDALIYQSSKLGAKGLISVLSNIWPEKVYHYICNCFHRYNLNSTDEDIWENAVKLYFSVTNPIAIKAILSDKDIIKSHTLRPPLTVADLHSIEKLREIDYKIINWNNSYKKIRY